VKGDSDRPTPKKPEASGPGSRAWPPNHATFHPRKGFATFEKGAPTGDGPAARVEEDSLPERWRCGRGRTGSCRVLSEGGRAEIALAGRKLAHNLAPQDGLRAGHRGRKRHPPFATRLGGGAGLGAWMAIEVALPGRDLGPREEESL